jgi:hypothetical protein
MPVALLASIVLTRTFLTMILTFEIERCWPWQRDTKK